MRLCWCRHVQELQFTTVEGPRSSMPFQSLGKAGSSAPSS